MFAVHQPLLKAMDRTDILEAPGRFKKKEVSPATQVGPSAADYKGLSTVQRNLKKAKKFGVMLAGFGTPADILPQDQESDSSSLDETPLSQSDSPPLTNDIMPPPPLNPPPASKIPPPSPPSTTTPSSPAMGGEMPSSPASSSLSSSPAHSFQTYNHLSPLAKSKPPTSPRRNLHRNQPSANPDPIIASAVHGTTVAHGINGTPVPKPRTRKPAVKSGDYSDAAGIVSAQREENLSSDAVHHSLERNKPDQAKDGGKETFGANRLSNGHTTYLWNFTNSYTADDELSQPSMEGSGSETAAIQQQQQRNQSRDSRAAMSGDYSSQPTAAQEPMPKPRRYFKRPLSQCKSSPGINHGYNNSQEQERSPCIHLSHSSLSQDSEQLISSATPTFSIPKSTSTTNLSTAAVVPDHTPSPTPPSTADSAHTPNLAYLRKALLDDEDGSSLDFQSRRLNGTLNSKLKYSSVPNLLDSPPSSPTHTGKRPSNRKSSSSNQSSLLRASKGAHMRASSDDVFANADEQHRYLGTGTSGRRRQSKSSGHSSSDIDQVMHTTLATWKLS